MDWQTLASQFNHTMVALKDVLDADRIEFWVQSWPDTSCGYGCGGQAFTPSLVVAVVYGHANGLPHLRVYSKGRLLHDVLYGPEQRQALEDRRVPGKGMRWWAVRT